MMKVLVACEYSGIVRQAFRDRGHDAWSCDLLPAADGSEYHFEDDIAFHLHAGWDLLIAHPPCDHLAVSGARWFKDKQKDGRQQKAIDFFMMLAEYPHIPKIAVENPIGIMSTNYRKPDQIVHPWMFGDPYSKATCWWLKGLPKLEPTVDVDTADKGEFVIHGGKKLAKWYSNRERKRDMTFPGMAHAMAEQWTNE